MSQVRRGLGNDVAMARTPKPPLTPAHLQRAWDNQGLIVFFLNQLQSRCHLPRQCLDGLREELFDALAKAARDHDPQRGAFSTCGMRYLRTAWINWARQRVQKSHGHGTETWGPQGSNTIPDLRATAPTPNRKRLWQMRRKVLSSRESRVLTLRVRRRWTLLQIGEKMELTKQAIQIIETKALRKLALEARRRGWTMDDLMEDGRAL